LSEQLLGLLAQQLIIIGEPRHSSTALALYQAIGDRVGTSNTLWGLGQRLAGAGELAAAEPLMAEAVDLAQAFAPGHPVTEYWIGVLAQVRAQLHSEAKDEQQSAIVEQEARALTSYGNISSAARHSQHDDERKNTK
jgi:hypothetical protein